MLPDPAAQEIGGLAPSRFDGCANEDGALAVFALLLGSAKQPELVVRCGVRARPSSALLKTRMAEYCANGERYTIVYEHRQEFIHLNEYQDS